MKSNPLALALAAKQQVSQPQPGVPPPRPPARPGKRQVSVYLPLPVHEHLRRLSFESRCSMHSILMASLDKVLGEHGTSIEQLVRDGESN